MRLKIPLVDLRSQNVGSEPINDEDTGKSVGALRYGRQGGRTVSLFDGKYQATFDSHEECCAFAKGVQEVLNHMVCIKE
ncbi:hypothetical protein [Nitrobacter sp. JJSN]|uniref:hypothetical protein n=1 Tax=Nitrobacter sp. JJSN TaxID=3453033 RepID=UPI003F75DED8